jgi:hypothetical protein
MSYRKIVLWCALAIPLILVIAVISIPNLLRAKISAHQTTRARAIAMLHANWAAQQDQQRTQGASEDHSNQEGRKLIQTATLDLVVASVQDAISRIEALAEGAGGYVEKCEFQQALIGQQSAGLVLRVPESRVGNIRNEIKNLAQRVESDKSEARDVTREFVDSEARLRNMKAEELQYLELMHRSTSTKDIVDITSRLSGVRGRIEELTAELRSLSHQVEMSSITITLSTEYVPSDKLEWHPVRNVQIAFRDMLEAVIGYADAMISFVLFVPVILLWTVTVVVGLVIAWKTLRWMFIRFIRAKASGVPAT